MFLKKKKKLGYQDKEGKKDVAKITKKNYKV